MPLVAFKPTKARLVIEQGRESILVMKVIVAKGETVALAIGGRLESTTGFLRIRERKEERGRNENKAVGSIVLGGALEFGVVDGKGRLFINVEDKNEIAVVDIAARKLITRYPMPGCQGPTGLALTADGRLISSCRNGVAKIVDSGTGKEIASLAIGQGPDAVFQDAGRAQAYIPSGRTGTLAVIALAGAANNTVIDTVTTKPGARTGTVDPKTGRIYLPSASYTPAGAPGQRPGITPGSFAVLVVGR